MLRYPYIITTTTDNTSHHIDYDAFNPIYEVKTIVNVDGKETVKTYSFASLQSAYVFIARAKNELNVQSYRLSEVGLVSARILEKWFAN